MIRVAVVGATGYTGEELAGLLADHPGAEITSLTAIIDAPAEFGTLFPRFKGKIGLICKQLDIEEVGRISDLVFLALPHRVSMEIAPEFLKVGKKVIDLSADYRLEDVDEYQKWYGAPHKDRANLKNAVYGLPEAYREKIKKANLIANPGCYPTGAILAILPMARNKADLLEYIIVDAKSGVTGAGRKADVNLSFGEVDGNFKAYKVNEHQHKPEITQELSSMCGKKVEIAFTPHLAPMQRGILSTVYLKMKKGVSEDEALEMYNRTYRNEPFVRVFEKGKLPQIKDTVKTNYCDIGIKTDEKEGLVIVVSTIDNLMKGASGQALQNMNIMCGFDEKTGLA